MTQRFKDEPDRRNDKDTGFSDRRVWLQICQILFTVGFLLTLISTATFAADYIEEFEDETPTWQPYFAKNAEIRLRHRRNSESGRGGQGCEEIHLFVGRKAEIARFEHELPHSVPIDDLYFSVAVRSNSPGLKVALRMVFPNQGDPTPRDSQANSVLTAYLVGEKVYTDVGRWQTLEVRPTERTVATRLKLLRGQYKTQSLDLSGAYFDRAVILGDFSPGTNSVYIDDLAWTGYVSSTVKQIMPVSAESTVTPLQLPVKMRHDRLLIEGRPSIIRFTPHHDEPVERLQALGFNLVWINDYSDTKRIEELREHGLWAMATPPRPTASDDPNGPPSAMESFDHRTDGVLLWYLATQVPGEAKEEIDTQARRIRAADRQRPRPIIADVGGLERSFSRILDGVGLTRHPLQTELSLKNYRDVLIQKMRLLRPGTFTATWLQTEIEPTAQSRVRPIIEPEQIRLMGYAALTAGCRGIGYWKRTAYDAELPGAREREYAVAILNQEIELLEPWLATRTVTDFQKIPLGKMIDDDSEAADRFKAQSTRLRVKSSSKLTPKTSSGERFVSYPNDELEMAIVHCPIGMLVLPIWYQKDSQFVPGQMAAKNVELVVPGVPDTATVWELSTTRVRTLKPQSTSSGARIKLENFDQVTALVVSTDPNWGRLIREKVDRLQDRSAALWLNLAKAKYERVQAVDAELQQMRLGNPASFELLDQARLLIRRAEDSYHRLATANRDSVGRIVAVGHSGGLDFDTVRESATGALQALRILQRLHWERANSNRPSALFTPYSSCFQTLPEHWRFIERVGASPVADATNLLSLGNFENTDTEQLLQSGWKIQQDEIDTLQAGAHITQGQGERGQCLRLLSLPKPNTTPPSYIDGTPISVSTPAVSVRAGQMVHISGVIRISIEPTATFDGVSLQENLTGTRLQWKQTRGWQRFEMVREVKSEATLTLKLTHHGIGEVYFDDLRIVVTSE